MGVNCFVFYERIILEIWEDIVLNLDPLVKDLMVAIFWTQDQVAYCDPTSSDGFFQNCFG